MTEHGRQWRQKAKPADEVATGPDRGARTAPCCTHTSHCTARTPPGHDSPVTARAGVWVGTWAGLSATSKRRLNPWACGTRYEGTAIACRPALHGYAYPPGAPRTRASCPYLEDRPGDGGGHRGGRVGRGVARRGGGGAVSRRDGRQGGWGRRRHPIHVPHPRHDGLAEGSEARSTQLRHRRHRQTQQDRLVSTAETEHASDVQSGRGASNPQVPPASPLTRKPGPRWGGTRPGRRRPP